MVGKNPLTNEWVQMTNTVGGGRSLENYSIPIALANRAPPMPPLAKRKEEEHVEDEDQDAGGQGKGRRKKLRKGKTKDQENEGIAQQGGDKKTMDINPIIKAKVTPVLPEFLDIKKLCAMKGELLDMVPR